MPTARPIAIRTGGCSQPCWIEYPRKKTAATASAMPATHENRRTPISSSQSNAGCAGRAGSAGRAGGGDILGGASWASASRDAGSSGSSRPRTGGATTGGTAGAGVGAMGRGSGGAGAGRTGGTGAGRTGGTGGGGGAAYGRSMVAGTGAFGAAGLGASGGTTGAANRESSSRDSSSVTRDCSRATQMSRPSTTRNNSVIPVAPCCQKRGRGRRPELVLPETE
jgi:hypothetical protein